MARDKEDSEDTGKSGKGGKGVKGMLAGHPVSFWVNSALGKPLMMIGLVMVILSRGCDAASTRSVSKSNAAYQALTISFELQEQAKIAPTALKLAKRQRDVDDLRKLQRHFPSVLLLPV